jgi:hypothetical protein
MGYQRRNVLRIQILRTLCPYSDEGHVSLTMLADVISIIYGENLLWK